MTGAAARKAIVLVLLLPWLAALALPVAINRQGVFTGATILLLGLMGPLIGQFGWLGNPLLLVGLRRIWPTGKPRDLTADRVIGGLLALLFVNSLFWTDIPTDAGSDPIMRAIGYHLWMTSVAAGAMTLLLSRAWREKVRP